MLLDAARECDAMIHAREDAGRSFPTLVIFITGRGPLRAEFESRISGLALRKVCIHTLWLEPEDYPLLLGAADLGVCLHRSASGLDLPMKIADMFGSGLPVCALDYGPCLAEQLQHGVNGLLFTDGAQLAEQICRLFERFPAESPQLDEMRRTVASRSNERWEREWIVNALPLLRHDRSSEAAARCLLTRTSGSVVPSGDRERRSSSAVGRSPRHCVHDIPRSADGR